MAIIPAVPRRLEYFGEFKCDARTREKLLKISAATIDRLLAPERASISCEAAAHARIYEIESSGAETKDRGSCPLTVGLADTAGQTFPSQFRKTAVIISALKLKR